MNLRDDGDSLNLSRLLHMSTSQEPNSHLRSNDFNSLPFIFSKFDINSKDDALMSLGSHPISYLYLYRLYNATYMKKEHIYSTVYKNGNDQNENSYKSIHIIHESNHQNS